MRKLMFKQMSRLDKIIELKITSEDLNWGCLIPKLMSLYLVSCYVILASFASTK